MFGVLAPCSARMCRSTFDRWMGHFCGLCLRLRDAAGQPYRLATNYDAVALSVLTEAQGSEETRRAGPCALRGMRGQTVNQGQGPTLAATASLLLASAKWADHRADRDGSAVVMGRRAMRACRNRAVALGTSVGVDVPRLETVIARQSDVEAAAGPDTPVTAVTAPAEEVTATLFAHTAQTTGRMANVGPLEAMGAAFGRLAHLLDAVEDRDRDARRGAWNPLDATGTDLAEAERLCDAALADIDAALAVLECDNPGMARTVTHKLAQHAVDKRFGRVCATTHSTPLNHDRLGPPRGFWAGLCPAVGLCVSCRCCCAREYRGPWSGKRREGCCRDCCGDCGCGNCGCDCCDCGC